MSGQSARLALPYIQPSQAQKHVTHNEALEILDLLVQLVVESFDASTPPALPEDGQVWALGAAPGGDWAGQALKLAARVQGGWVFIAPQPGWRAWGRAEEALRLWTGTQWVAPEAAAPDFDDLSGLGINTGFDATNRLSVAAAATLLSHEGAGHQLKINKADAADTASLLFQTGWSGRAEMGTAGSDDFSVKVSPDGSMWYDAIKVAVATGKATLKEVEAEAIVGNAVTHSATDATAGRLMKNGSHGLGETSIPPQLNDLSTMQGQPSGFFRTTASGTDFLNAFGCGSGIVLWSRFNSNNGAGLVIDPVEGNSAWIIRERASTETPNSSELYHSDNLLGTVSQSGGRPTGSVMQHGANSNGRFERRASGWMECIRTDLAVTDVDAAAGSLYRSADVSWTFPSAFMSGEAPVITVAADHADATGFSVVSISETAVTFRITAHSAITGSVTIRASATGRWSDMS